MPLTSLGLTERLLIDGNNLLHRVAGGVDPGALRLLLSRLRGSLPPTVQVQIVLDGHPAPGTDRFQRITPNLQISHAGSLSADDRILNLVRDTEPRDRSATTVVTDDRPLSDKARHLGAHTQRLDWLESVLGHAAPKAGIGAGSRPRQSGQLAPSRGGTEEEPERPPWQPGRGATKKRGNPRRSGRGRDATSRDRP